jgi:hypothetical protein
MDCRFCKRNHEESLNKNIKVTTNIDTQKKLQFPNGFRDGIEGAVEIFNFLTAKQNEKLRMKMKMIKNFDLLLVHILMEIS